MTSSPGPKQSFGTAGQTLRQSRTIKRAAKPQDKLARLKALQNRMRDHVKRHEALWIGRELSKLVRERTKPELHHPAPFGLPAKRMSPEALVQRARMNVKSRITRRLTCLKVLEDRLKRAEGKVPTQEHTKTFNQSLKPSKGPKL